MDNFLGERIMRSFSHHVNCPNCGKAAERFHLEQEQLTRTQCPSCDYLMITCSSTGKVIEAYAPGIFVGQC